MHITGLSGTGKSTLAEHIARTLDLPLIHLDDVARDAATGARRSGTERLAMVAEIAAAPRWVTDGVQTGWTDVLCERADVIVWLDHLAGSQAVLRIAQRFARQAWREVRTQRGRRRFFRIHDYFHHARAFFRSVREVRAFDRGPADTLGDGGSRAATEAQLRPYAAKSFHCRTPADIDAFLASIGSQGWSVDPDPIDAV